MLRLLIADGDVRLLELHIRRLPDSAPLGAAALGPARAEARSLNLNSGEALDIFVARSVDVEWAEVASHSSDTRRAESFIDTVQAGDGQLETTVETAAPLDSASAFALPSHQSDRVHSLERWSEPIIRLLGVPEDPRTIADWGRTVGVSAGALRNWCRTAGIPPRRTLLFARLLRAVARQNHHAAGAEHLLNVVDRRTLGKMLLLSGSQCSALPLNIRDYLDRQRLISNKDAVDEVRRALASSSYSDLY